jgi:hypothetical protein
VTRRKIVIGKKPATTCELRSRPGTKPAWSRTIVVSDADPRKTAIIRGFVDAALGGVAGIDAYMDTLDTPPAPASGGEGAC